jgi:beta-ribofuranosylaminobenzene 5'-phosphate synthase
LNEIICRIINKIMDKSVDIGLGVKDITDKQVRVLSSARLHMGFFDLHGGLGRKFGSIGLSIDSPSIDLTAKPSNKLTVATESTFPVAQLERVRLIAEAFMLQQNINSGLMLNIRQMIPEHTGLGSGTQIALAVGSAINNLYSLGLSTRQIAGLTGRGGRSGIGIAAFDQGGLLIDGGRTVEVKDCGVPPLLARYAFPDEWRILLIFDNGFTGVHGKEELEAFKKLPVFPENLAAHLCRHVLMQAMPALVERDLNAFGNSIQALQSHVGDYFAPAQGGRYASSKVAKVLEYLEKDGLACFGQSSWGPTGFAVFENVETAERYLEKLKLCFTDTALDWEICSARNHGAIIS